MVDVAGYRRQAQQLLPRGRIWPRAGSRFESLLDSFAEEFARVDERVAQALLEADPRTTRELLLDWERNLGMPAPFSELPSTIVGRRFAIVTKLTDVGGQNPGYYSDVGQSLGYDVDPEDVEEYREFRCGVSACGDPLSNGDWAHTFTLHAPVHTSSFFRAGESTAGEPLMEFGNGPLIEFVTSAAPAHSIVLFEFDKPYSGWAPWNDIRPSPTVLATLRVPDPIVFIHPL